MCPPPSEPIRPIGPLAGDVYVERTYASERVERRRRRGDQDPDRERDHGHHGDDADPETGERWFGGRPPLAAAGGYDDHGRRQAAADAAAKDRAEPHVDRTA